MHGLVARVFVWHAIALVALFMAIGAADSGFAIHMGIIAAAALLTASATMSRADYGVLAGVTPAETIDRSRYDDDVIRLGVIATVFWGLVGFLVGVIFAFGGNALIATSFYVVQRTCRARLAFPGLAIFVFWGYQLFIVLAATGYLLGITESREYAEPEWYVDIWLTMVGKPISRRRRPRPRRH